MENALGVQDQIDKALLDEIFGRSKRDGYLRFGLTPSMDAVRHQKVDLPYE